MTPASASASALRQGAGGLRQVLPERRPATPPEDTARRLVTLSRTTKDGQAEELRLSWSEYEGRPYVSVRWWTQDANGSWWPEKARGFTIRVRELPEFADGIAQALELAEEHVSQEGEPVKPGTWG